MDAFKPVCPTPGGWLVCSGGWSAAFGAVRLLQRQHTNACKIKNELTPSAFGLVPAEANAFYRMIKSNVELTQSSISWSFPSLDRSYGVGGGVVFGGRRGGLRTSRVDGWFGKNSGRGIVPRVKKRRWLRLSKAVAYVIISPLPTSAFSGRSPRLCRNSIYFVVRATI